MAQTPERSTRFDRALPSTSATQERPLMHCDATGPCVVPTTLGALGGAGLGALAGGGALLVYALVAGGVDSDDGGPGMLALGGALVGAGIGMPLGAHLANRERGSLVLDFVVPVAATALAGRVAQEAGVRVGIVIPVTALVSVVATEIITGR